jgi:hypothetical protein
MVQSRPARIVHYHSWSARRRLGWRSVHPGLSLRSRPPRPAEEAILTEGVEQPDAVAPCHRGNREVALLSEEEAHLLLSLSTSSIPRAHASFLPCGIGIIACASAHHCSISAQGDGEDGVAGKAGGGGRLGRHRAWQMRTCGRHW